VLPASFLERVRAAAEAERRMEQQAGEQAGPSPESPPEPRPEPPAARPEGPGRPPRFVRSRDWMARAGEKKDRGRGDQAGPAQPRPPAGDQPGPARDVMTKGGPGPAEPGPPPALPRRKMGTSHPPRPVPQAQPDAAGAPAARKPSDASTEPIPVIRVPPPGQPPRPGQPPWEDRAGGVAARDARAAEQAAAQEAPLAQAAAQDAPVAQAAAQDAPVAQAAAQEGPVAQAAAQDAPVAQAAAQEGPVAQAAAQDAPVAQAAAQPSAAAGAAEQAAGRPAGTADARRAGWAAAGQAAADQAAADRAGAQAAAAQAAARRAADEAAVQRAARLLARPPSALNRRLVGLAAGSLLVIGGVTAAAVFLASSGHHSHLASSNTVATVVVNRDHAAAWVAKQVSPGAMVSCDPVTCVVLESHGFPASHVRALETGKDTPLSSDLVVATPAVRHQFGAQLARVYAPGLLASFGSGRQQVDIRIVAPHGVPAYQSELRADLQNRRMSGAGLSGSNRIQAPATARQQLAAGQVDARLMITLALMASLHPLHLVAFGDGGPDPAAAPFRSVQLSLTASAQKQSLLAFLAQQRPPYQPAHVTTRQTGQDRTILIMEFAAPSPVGLFH
jgi:hypothetical protein